MGRWPVLLIVFVVALVAEPVAASPTTPPGPHTYRNPVIQNTAPDPAIIKALDGYYYLVATSDFQPGGSFHILPTWRSTDLVSWQFVGDGMPARPDWVAPGAGLWAPDLQYVNGRYYIYYVASDTRALPRYGTSGGSAIGVAVADSPAGPWRDAGPSAGSGFATGPLVPPRPCTFTTDPSCSYWTIDPALFTDVGGQRYLYWGSYFGGTVVQRVSQDGLRLYGPVVQVGHWDRYEGTYVIRHDVGGQAYYYNFSSSANCCQGPNTAYSVVVSRATSPLGPFVDQNGIPMERPPAAPVPTGRPTPDPAGANLGGEGGGYSTLKQNGNRWHGPGHNALVADLSGRDWIVYHAVDGGQGWVDGLGPGVQITYRQLLVDRVDWTADGWPVVNGGQGPSDTDMPAPVTQPAVGDNFNPPQGCAAPGPGGGLDSRWQALGGSWRVNPGNCTSGGFAEQTSTGGGLLMSRGLTPAGSRVQCDVRLGASSDGRDGCGIALSAETSGRSVTAFLDSARHALVSVASLGGRAAGQEQVTPLPASFDFGAWHHLTIDQLGRGQYRFTVSEWDRDPLVEQNRTLPAELYGAGRVTLVAQGAGAAFDNVAAAALDLTPAPPQEAPRLGRRLSALSDEFDGPLGSQWSWLREVPGLHSIGGGYLSITANGDLYRDQNSATNVLLESPPQGDYVVQTRMLFDPDHNYQQAGILIYSDDDHYLKIGPAHLDSLTRVLSGRETLEPLPSGSSSCDVQPAPGSNVAVHAYTRDQCPNEGEAWDYPSNPNQTPNGAAPGNPNVATWLRVYRHGDLYTPYVSLDGTRWVKGSSWTLGAVSPAFPVRVGLFAFSGGPYNNVPARFDYFRVYAE